MNKYEVRFAMSFLSLVARRVALVAGLVAGLTACGPSSVMLHSRTGDPILLQESAFTADGCRQDLQEEAERIGMTLRSADVKGSLFGEALLWPFVKGYVCVGTAQELPRGITGTTTLYGG